MRRKFSGLSTIISSRGEGFSSRARLLVLSRRITCVNLKLKSDPARARAHDETSQLPFWLLFYPRASGREIEPFFRSGLGTGKDNRRRGVGRKIKKKKNGTSEILLYACNRAFFFSRKIYVTMKHCIHVRARVISFASLAKSFLKKNFVKLWIFFESRLVSARSGSWKTALCISSPISAYELKFEIKRFTMYEAREQLRILSSRHALRLGAERVNAAAAPADISSRVHGAHCCKVYSRRSCAWI